MHDRDRAVAREDVAERQDGLARRAPAATCSSSTPERGHHARAHLLGAEAAHRALGRRATQRRQLDAAGVPARRCSAGRTRSPAAVRPARAPARGSRPARVRPERCGMACSRRRVYGCEAEREQLVRGAELDDPPGVHHRDALGQRADHGEVVADVERRRRGAPRPARARCRARAPASSRRGRSSARRARSGCGRQANAMARPMRCCWPPESSCG